LHWRPPLREFAGQQLFEAINDSGVEHGVPFPMVD
jgi:hypothetical protein